MTLTDVQLQILRYNYNVYLTSPYGVTWSIVVYDYMSNISAFYTFLNCSNWWSYQNWTLYVFIL